MLAHAAASRASAMIATVLGRAARYLRSARSAAGLTQLELAERSGVSQRTVAAIEAGKREPRFRTLVRLLRACDFDIDIHPLPSTHVDRAVIRAMLALSPSERLRAASGRGLIRMPSGPDRRSELQYAELVALRDEIEGITPKDLHPPPFTKIDGAGGEPTQ